MTSYAGFVLGGAGGSNNNRGSSQQPRFAPTAAINNSQWILPRVAQQQHQKTADNGFLRVTAIGGNVVANANRAVDEPADQQARKKRTAFQWRMDLSRIYSDIQTARMNQADGASLPVATTLHA